MIRLTSTPISTSPSSASFGAPSGRVWASWVSVIGIDHDGFDGSRVQKERQKQDRLLATTLESNGPQGVLANRYGQWMTKDGAGTGCWRCE